jgi:hypothetical protein
VADVMAPDEVDDVFGDVGRGRSLAGQRFRDSPVRA